MARKRPPQHRADTPGIYIPKSDSSFDVDRFEKEIARMKTDGLDINTHPIEVYYSGRTRYDLDATEVLFGGSVCARDYFDGSKEPERWTLRRLSWDQWHKVAALVTGGNFDEGMLVAARFGITGVENSPLKPKGAEVGLLTYEDCQAIFDADQSLLSSLGYAVWRYSQELTGAEKKA